MELSCWETSDGAVRKLAFSSITVDHEALCRCNRLVHCVCFGFRTGSFCQPSKCRKLQPLLKIAQGPP